MDTTIKITGMQCQHCVQHVTDALRQVSGVESVEVDLEQGRAVVQHGTTTPLSDLLEAVEEEGYQATAP